MNSRYKVVKTIDRKYYKLLPWTQPVLSANGTLGGDSFACIASSEYTISGTTHYAYKALDANSSTNWLTGTYSNTDLPIYLIVYNPEPLNVTSMTVANRSTYNTYATEGNVYASNDGNNYILLRSFTNSVSGKNSTWTIDLSGNSGAYKYYKLEITAGVWDKSKSNGMGISELELTADQVIEATEQDYDFYEDVEQHKVVKETTRKYYKYVDQVWTNPIMTAQIEPGGTEFAAFMDSTYSTRYAYHMFDGQSSGAGTGYIAQTQGTLPHFLGFYNPNPVRITNITFIWYKATSGYYSPKNGQLEASNDGINYTSLKTFSYSTMPQSISFTFPSNDYYKYYRIYGTDGGVTTQYVCAECTVSGYARTGIEEAAEQDYDFYENTEVYKAILI